MADVEPKRVDESVVEQTITPRPSPDEAIISTGDSTIPSAEAIATIAAAPSTSDNKNSDVVAIPDGIVVTTEAIAHDSLDKKDAIRANGTTSPATSPSTIHNRDEDNDAGDRTPNERSKESTEPVRVDGDKQQPSEPVDMEEGSTSSSDDSNSSKALHNAAMAATDPMMSVDLSSDPGDQIDELALIESFGLIDNLGGLKNIESINWLEAILGPVVGTTFHPDFTDRPSSSQEHNDIIFDGALHLDPDDPTFSTETLFTEVAGGVWHPTHPPDGRNPRIEAFAKLEFDHGQDFYLACLNIVLGRHDRNPEKAARILRRNTGLSLDAASIDEIKVPVLTDLPLSSISRRHVRVAYNYEKTAWEATALCPVGFRRSRSGKSRTYRNGEACVLSNTDIVTFGNITFTFYLPQDGSDDRDSEDREGIEDLEGEEITPRGRARKSLTASSEHESDDGDDEDEGSDSDGREQSNDITLPTGGDNGTDDTSLMPPPPVKRGRGRPPKNGISVREQKLLKRKAQEAFIANNGDVSNIDVKKFGSVGVEELFAKEGEKMQMQMEKEALRKRKAEEKEARDREKKAIKDSKPPKTTKERKRKRSKSPPAREEDYLPEQLLKPTVPYTVMIWEAIEASEKKALTLPEIYKSLEESYPYFKVKAETTGWQSSVRHNLRGSGEGGSALFKRGERSGKGFIWEIIEGADIEKERRKKRTGTSSAAPSAHTVPSGGTWDQSAQMSHANSLGQQYQPQPMAATQTFASRPDPQYVQAGHQVAAPTASSAPIPSAVPNGHSPNSTSAPPRSIQENQPITTSRPASQAAVPPPLSWNPSQPRTASTSTSTNGNSHAPLTQHTISNGVTTHSQQPARQSHVAATGSPQAPKPATGTLGKIPPPPTTSSKPPTATGDDQSSVQAVPGTKLSQLENKLVKDPLFRQLVHTYMAKYPTKGMDSHEVLRSLWTEFRAGSGKNSPANGNSPKTPALSLTQSQAVPPARNTIIPATSNGGSSGTSARTSAVSVSSAAPARTATVEAGQAKPATPASLAPRASNLLRNIPMDAKKRAELLQVLKRAKEKKAAEGSASPATGVKRPAEPSDDAPPAKRQTIEGQQ
ncbi:hypothetical protein ABW21_db0208495 [Orbilia brochopaga]|nr:hypothetical protein ABW21_db0208495 [Drechslerella brochopaga]